MQATKYKIDIEQLKKSIEKQDYAPAVALGNLKLYNRYMQDVAFRAISVKYACSRMEIGHQVVRPQSTVFKILKKLLASGEYEEAATEADCFNLVLLGPNREFTFKNAFLPTEAGECVTEPVKKEKADPVAEFLGERLGDDADKFDKQEIDHSLTIEEQKTEIVEKTGRTFEEQVNKELAAEEKDRAQSPTEKAKIIKQLLKKTFPGFRFSVCRIIHPDKTYIIVSWEAGPSKQKVKELTEEFKQGSLIIELERRD